jgi:hypothetical protein
VLVVLLIVLLLAAAGILGTVLEVTLVIVLSVVLSIVVLGWIVSWYAKRRFRAFQQDAERRLGEMRRRREAHDVGAEHRPPAAGSSGHDLPDASR